MSKGTFVYVVCGSQEHIDTLHLSIKYLLKYSKNEIVVITDNSRNEIPVIHSQVIDVKTPEHLNNHQASIYLKTGIHKFLPKGELYCYLDTDIVAVSPACDDIFNEFIAPIRFAPDHCKVKKFSSYAVNCNCSENWKVNRDLFKKEIEKSDKNKQITDPILIEQAKALQYIFSTINKSMVKKIAMGIRFVFSYPIFKLNEQFYFDRVKRTWHNQNNEVVLHEVNIKKIEKATGLKYRKWDQKWLDKDGADIWFDACNHLTEYIANTFKIDVKDKNWQHWNGGVFLFNDSSHTFLDAWHNKTMHIFNLKEWKVRDQGTLIATAWEFGLENHPTLPKKFNFIADYNNNGVQINTQTGYITDDGFITQHNPALVHVYHHWGNQTWPIWQWIETKL